jgi:hypothetical protein
MPFPSPGILALRAVNSYSLTLGLTAVRTGPGCDHIVMNHVSYNMYVRTYVPITTYHSHVLRIGYSRLYPHHVSH